MRSSESEITEKAQALRRAVRTAERERLNEADYSERQIRQSIVHSREDIILMVSHLRESAILLSRMSKWLALLTYINFGALIYQIFWAHGH